MTGIVSQQQPAHLLAHERIQLAADAWKVRSDTGNVTWLAGGQVWRSLCVTASSLPASWLTRESRPTRYNKR
jgi:hypothetical protein